MGQAVIEKVKGTTRDGVRRILSDYPETRNDDRVLCVTYWKVVDHAVEINDIMAATSPEAIRRARQWLNERGSFLATDEETLRKRKQFMEEPLKHDRKTY